MDFLLLLLAAPVTLWMAGAIYYDLLRAENWSALLTVLWVVVVALLFWWWQPTWQPFLLLIWLFAIFVGWWRTLKPSNSREWDANSAVLPRAVLDGDVVSFENIRNTTYRSRVDYTPSYYDKQFRLSKLCAVDLLLYYWGSRWMSHPTLIFDFGEEGRVCISIEVRYERGQEYNILRSIYRQQELIYMVSDELDAVLQETEFAAPNADTYLYRLQVDPTEARIALLDYVSQVENLYECPRWYNGISDNCTTAIFRHPNYQFEWDWRMLVNGWLDQCLYDRGRLDQSVPFSELKQRSRINDLLPNASRESLGDCIRAQLWKDATQTESEDADPIPNQL